MARPKTVRPLKSVTINLRLTISEKSTLEEIAAREERTASFLIGWFTRWSIAHYKDAGSLMRLKHARLHVPEGIPESTEEADYRLDLEVAAYRDRFEEAPKKSQAKEKSIG